MGISGLLPLLKSIHKPCDLKKFAGQTIGVDAYGWLHRGAVACAVELALGKPTRRYVDFAMHRVRMMQHFEVTPFIVFDGDYLPSKAATEHERAQRRAESKRAGLELQRLGKTTQAYQELQKAVDVTPEMARQLIDELKRVGVQYVVAPYEADAQLVYLERTGFISGMISEDSDLLVFGAKCLLTKLDQYGNCVVINRADFTACRDISLVGWSDTDFRRMAILSGCDYLRNMNKMGLKTAYRLVRKYKTIHRIVKAVQLEGQIKVPEGYVDAFIQAELTFLHQRVFCPTQRMLALHTELEEGMSEEDLPFIGRSLPQDLAIGVACGELHPMTKEPLIVQETIASAPPRTPWARNQQKENNPSRTFENLKEGVSIEKYFKLRRTPLAELDPNSFTPSPTQQRALQRHSNASWSSSPLSGEVGGSREYSTRSLAPRITPTSAQNISFASWTKPASNSRPQKRPRLCSDNTENPQIKASEGGKSRYFTANSQSVVSSPKVRTPRRKKQNATINIFSDDSIDAAMASMPDVVDEGQASKLPRLEIFEDGAQKLGDVDSSNEVQTQISQTPTPPKIPRQALEVSSPTRVVSESPRSPIKTRRPPEVNVLRENSIFQSSRVNSERYSGRNSPTSLSRFQHYEDLRDTSIKSRALTTTSISPIQSNPLIKQHHSALAPASLSPLAPKSNSKSKSPTPIITHHGKFQEISKSIPRQFGSEDLIIPDSEADDDSEHERGSPTVYDSVEDDDEDDNEDHSEHRSRPVATLDLDRFLFRANTS
ncbi:MAG: hypothetical protein M4579_003031 [Chaenotheca gracillima]|nr:MAG: hypothetical protein M4579_003031 [Chaenotheca gracillima]